MRGCDLGLQLRLMGCGGLCVRVHHLLAADLSELAPAQQGTAQQTKQTIEPHSTQIPKARTSKGRQGPLPIAHSRLCALPVF
jgi:hypothetical protein